MALADLVVVMNEGRIEQAAPPRTVFERPATAFVARFMGDHNVVSGRVTGNAAGVVHFDIPSGGSFAATGNPQDVGSTVDIAIRTDHVRIGEPPSPGLGFVGVVSNIEYRGSSVKMVASGAGFEDFTVHIDDTDFFSRSVKTGDALPLAWDADDALVLGRFDS